MKKYLIITAIAVFPLISKAQIKVDTLTNSKIIKLSKLNLPPCVLINKIQTSYDMFDVSTDALIKLSDNGVSPDVINSMMQANSKTQETVANQKDMTDPNTMHRSGIYLYNPADKFKPVRRVDPTVISTGKSGGFGTFVAQAYTYGIAQSHVKSELAGKSSRLQINNSAPVFYFYFENNSNPKAEDWFFATATSPNEFILVKLKEKSDNREMIVGSANAYSSSTGISNKIKMEYDYEEVSDGVYKVTLKRQLEKGEYCFLYASATPTQYSNNKVWDFGISNGIKQDTGDPRLTHPSPPNPFNIFKKKTNSSDTTKVAVNSK